MEHSRESFDRTDEALTEVKQGISGDKTAEEIMEAVAEKSSLEARKGEMMDSAREEADRENQERAYAKQVREQADAETVKKIQAEIAETVPKAPEAPVQVVEKQKAVPQEKVSVNLGRFSPTVEARGNYFNEAKLLAGVTGISGMEEKGFTPEQSYTPEQWKAIDGKLWDAQNESLSEIEKYAGKDIEKEAQSYNSYKGEKTWDYYKNLLNVKERKDKKVRKNILFGTAFSALTAFTGGLGVMAIGGLGTATAALGVAIATGGILGLPIIGGLAWAGKKAWDTYKEEKAAKNYAKADISSKARQNIREKVKF